ncbi:MAG: RsiV family protein [Anaerolineales bacterium]|nr:MAG: RsiV family protein [Anaerolineales bacterium]
MFVKLFNLLVTGLTLFSILAACSTVAQVPTPTPTAVPVNPTPLSSRVTLTYITFREDGSSPRYTITVQTPRLTGSEDERVIKFNERMNEVIQGEVNYFRENILAHMSSPPITSGSFLDVGYTLVYQRGDIWSLKFNFVGYSDGAAHPFHYSLTMNYDLEQGRKLSLDDLFVEDSGYLKTISSYCIAQLSKRDIGFFGGFEQGADPTSENYRNWNIANEGLLITFDEYQVAPYAAGPQTVTVPYSELKPLINQQGPLVVVLR